MEAVAKLTDGKIDSIPLQMALREHYETFFGIYNHDGDNVPLMATVLTHDKEKFLPYSRFTQMTRKYLDYGIKELLGLTLDQFLDRPRAEVEMLLDIAADHKRKKARAEESQSAALNEIAKMSNER